MVSRSKDTDGNDGMGKLSRDTISDVVAHVPSQWPLCDARFLSMKFYSDIIGQAVYFSFFSAERSPGAISRYINETRRVYGVIEMRLAEQRESLSRAPSRPPSRGDDQAEAQFLTDEETIAQAGEEEKEDILEQFDSDTPVWLVGNHCSIADLSFLTWANVVDRIGIDLETEYPVWPLDNTSHVSRKCRSGLTI